MAVYLEKQGNEGDAPALCKHAAIVRELASLHADWLMYDEQFHKIRARTGRHWAFKHNELYCQAVAHGLSTQKLHQNSSQAQRARSFNYSRNKTGGRYNQPFRNARFPGTEPLEPAGYTTQARTAGGASMITSVGTAKALTHLSNAPGCRHTTVKPSNKSNQPSAKSQNPQSKPTKHQ